MSGRTYGRGKGTHHLVFDQAPRQQPSWLDDTPRYIFKKNEAGIKIIDLHNTWARLYEAARLMMILPGIADFNKAIVWRTIVKNGEHSLLLKQLRQAKELERIKKQEEALNRRKLKQLLNPPPRAMQSHSVFTKNENKKPNNKFPKKKNNAAHRSKNWRR